MSGCTPRPRRDGLEALLAASSRGDREAFARLYDAVAPHVHGLVLRVVGDPDRSAEVTRQVLRELWLGAARFDPERGTALTWILSLAHRRAVDDLRSGRVATTAGDDSPASQPVRAALETLSPSQRRAVELSYYGGHTCTEVSRLMQIPVGTTRSRIRDGLGRLNDAIALESA